MIEIFSVISMQSTVNPTALAAGISEALITTYAGLVVAIPVIVMHRYLQTKADAYAEEMEEHSVGLMELLTEKAVQHQRISIKDAERLVAFGDHSCRRDRLQSLNLIATACDKSLLIILFSFDVQ